jgi:superfamily II DNA or RNA helicase
MNPKMILRTHQTDCIDTLNAYPEKFAVAEVSVAGGKSLILGSLAKSNTTGRTLILAHNKELVVQNAEACRQVGIQPGICSASIAKNVYRKVTVGTVQTVVRRTKHFQDVTLILVDEVHRTPVNKTSSYRQVFEAIPHAKVRGLTGTAFRADGTGSLEKTFGPIIFKYSFLDALQDGYVKPLIPAFSDDAAEIDVDGLKVVGEDYDLEEQASRAIALSPIHSKAIVETMKRQRRQCVLVFACNIAHADVLEERLNACGVEAAAVHSHSPKGKREKMVTRFRMRELPIMISVAMFDTGFNVVDIDMLAFCRATKSPVFFAQALGRGARVTPMAQNCAVLDFGGNVARHGSLDAIAAAPGSILVCDGCNTSWETWEHGRTCPKCKLVHKTATKCKGCTERFDQHYHGAVCPHCGLRQTSVKACNACNGIYATWLHPMCPHCGYDNTSVQKPGKDLTVNGANHELINISEIIKANPWQDICEPPFKYGTTWQIPTKYATVIWPYQILPRDIASVYLLKTANGRMVVKGWYDKSGKVHQI